MLSPFGQHLAAAIDSRDRHRIALDPARRQEAEQTSVGGSDSPPQRLLSKQDAEHVRAAQMRLGRSTSADSVRLMITNHTRPTQRNRRELFLEGQVCGFAGSVTSRPSTYGPYTGAAPGSAGAGDIGAHHAVQGNGRNRVHPSRSGQSHAAGLDALVLAKGDSWLSHLGSVRVRPLSPADDPESSVTQHNAPS